MKRENRQKAIAGKEREREGERVEIKRRCRVLVSSDVFEECCPIDELESVVIILVFRCVCVLAVSSHVLVVLDVLVSLSMVSVLGEVVLSDFDCEVVEPQSVSFSRKRQAFFVDSQGGLSIEGTLEKTPPVSREKINEAVLHHVVMTRMENYLD